MTAVKLLQARQSRLKAALARRRVAVDADSAQWAEVQAVLARGDRRLAPVLLEATPPSIRGFHEALAHQGLTAAEFTGARQPGTPQPWDIVESGVTPSFYRYELRLTQDGRLGHRCPPGRMHCATCGVCTDAVLEKGKRELCVDTNRTASPTTLSSR